MLLNEHSVGKDVELWEAKWQDAADGALPEPKISYKPVATTVDAPVQPQGIHNVQTPYGCLKPSSHSLPVRMYNTRQKHMA